MKWIADCGPKSRRFEIVHDPAVGYYLYVFENEKCVRDHLQDTLDTAIDNALEDYQLPRSAWMAVQTDD